MNNHGQPQTIRFFIQKRPDGPIHDSKDKRFNALLRRQYAFYRSFAKQTAKLPREKDIRLSCLEKLRVAAMIRFNTLPHPRPATANLARMMAFGSLAGIIDIKRKISDYGDASEDVRTLAKQLFSRELKNLAALLEFV